MNEFNQDLLLAKWMTTEIIVGAILGFLYHYFVLYTDRFKGFLFSSTYFGGLLEFYCWLSVVFFLATFTVGIVGAAKLRLSDNIAKAILYSALYWFLSLLVLGVLIGFFGSPIIIFNFIILMGIIFGFNRGLKTQATDFT